VTVCIRSTEVTVGNGESVDSYPKIPTPVARLSTVNRPDHETSGSSKQSTRGKLSEPIAYRCANILRTMNDADKWSVPRYKKRSGEGGYKHVRGGNFNGEGLWQRMSPYTSSSICRKSRCLKSLATPHNSEDGNAAIVSPLSQR
jgi:hypothetical protein